MYNSTFLLSFVFLSIFSFFTSFLELNAATKPIQGIANLNNSKLFLGLEKKYLGLISLECDFIQVTMSNGRLRRGKGDATFVRLPNQDQGEPGSGVMRWRYHAPEPQVILNDGKEVSIYTPADNQVVIAPAETMESDITYAIFSGKKKLADIFKVLPPEASFRLSEPVAEMKALLLIPKEEQSQVKKAQLWLYPDQSIQRLLMEDHFGALTELSFTHLRFNQLSKQQGQALLHLELAPGTEIIRQ